jgi:hypothetical protein
MTMCRNTDAPYTNDDLMKIPPELKAQFSRLSPGEISELEAWFDNLPVDDEEIRRLIADNLSLLIHVLTSETGTAAA